MGATFPSYPQSQAPPGLPALGSSGTSLLPPAVHGECLGFVRSVLPVSSKDVHPLPRAEQGCWGGSRSVLSMVPSGPPRGRAAPRSEQGPPLQSSPGM